MSAPLTEAFMGNHLDPDKPEISRTGMSRRGFLKGAGVTAASTVLTDAVLARAAEAADAPPGPDALNTVLEGQQKLTLNINGAAREVTVEPRTTLLSALRDHLEPPI